MSGIFLTKQEIENNFLTYEHFGPDKLPEFIQAVWKEAFEEGYNKAVRDKRGQS